MNISREKVSVVRVPFGLGGAVLGAERGPDSIMAAGLLDELKRFAPHGVSSDEIRLPPSPAIESVEDRAAPAADGGMIKFERQVREMCERTADRAFRAALYGNFPLVLGGDHSVAIGTLAGMSRAYDKLGVIWIDAHGDLNTEQTSPSGNAHGMVLAVASGLAAFKQTDIGQTRQLIRKRNIVLVGSRDLDEGEKTFIRRHGIHCFTMADIDKLGMEEVMNSALMLAGRESDGIHVSFDMDALDPLEAPGVGTPVPGGLTFREARLAMEQLSMSRAIASMDIVEVNPAKDSQGRTPRLAVELAAAFMGKRLI
ncbi:arginase [Paenibacillus sp. LHD-117]|uniref:arginase n=1 Tax=Paenibacillus sp. LHD-117 TaxID=3071412 RepID=UPI0027E009C6|nr:arginase [Paenibacillus sp. LHD-117]MDQ6419492.1 arginase [Paenibacillus sp. LHD-117]